MSPPAALIPLEGKLNVLFACWEMFNNHGLLNGMGLGVNGIR